MTGAVLRAIGGERREVRASVVVGADGGQSSVADWVGAEKYNEVLALRPAYYGYYHGLEPLPETTLELWFGGEQIGFVFPMRPDEDCIALEIQPEDFEAFRSKSKEMFEDRVRALPGMDRRMRGAALEGRVRGTRGIDNFFRKPFGPGWALTGDAGYLKDPSTGLGVGDALTQSMMLADALDAHLRGADWEESLCAFHTRRDSVMMPAYESTVAHTRLRDQPPEDVAWLRTLLSSPVVVRVLAQAVPGLVAQVYPAQTVPVLRASPSCSRPPLRQRLQQSVDRSQRPSLPRRRRGRGHCMT